MLRERQVKERATVASCMLKLRRTCAVAIQLFLDVGVAQALRLSGLVTSHEVYSCFLQYMHLPGGLTSSGTRA